MPEEKAVVYPTIDSVKADIELIEQESRKRLRHKRALLRCLEDEANDKQGKLFVDEDAEPAEK